MAALGFLKTTAGCVECGYDAHPAALDFDHLSEKYQNVSMLWCRSWLVIWREILKCDIVCANCHRVRTYERGQHG